MISVLMSVYNEEPKMLEESVNSILNQTYQDFELIIVLDNPYNEILKNILIEIQKKDNRVILIVNENNIGLANSLNKAFDISKGEFIARMDADDVSNIYRFEKQLFFFNNNKCDVLATDRIDIDDEGNILPTKHLCINSKKIQLKAIRYNNIFIHPTMMLKKEILKKAGGYRPFSTSQDYDLWLRLLKDNACFSVIEEPLLLYRVREGSITRKNFAFQHANHEYAKYLYRTGSIYSEEEKNAFFRKIHLDTVEQQELFNKAYKIMIQAKNYLNHKRFVLALMLFIKASIMHKEVTKYILEAFLFTTIIRKYSYISEDKKIYKKEDFFTC